MGVSRIKPFPVSARQNQNMITFSSEISRWYPGEIIPLVQCPSKQLKVLKSAKRSKNRNVTQVNRNTLQKVSFVYNEYLSSYLRKNKVSNLSKYTVTSVRKSHIDATRAERVRYRLLYWYISSLALLFKLYQMQRVLHYQSHVRLLGSSELVLPQRWSS